MKRNKIVKTLALALGILSLPIVSNDNIIQNLGFIEEANAAVTYRENGMCFGVDENNQATLYKIEDNSKALPNGEFTLPDYINNYKYKVVAVTDSLFRDNLELKSFSLGYGGEVKKIPENMFYGCTNLESVSL